MPRHMEPHPQDQSMVWDANFGQYIQNPDPAGTYRQAIQPNTAAAPGYRADDGFADLYDEPEPEPPATVLQPNVQASHPVNPGFTYPTSGGAQLPVTSGGAMNPTPQGAPDVGSGGAGITASEYEQFLNDFGLNDIPTIPGITLPDTPRMNEGFSPGFNQSWQENVSRQSADLGKFYDWGNWPTMNAAQLDLGGVPQPSAQTPGSNAALDFLLSGQGFAPEIQTMLRARAGDDVSREAAGARSSAKLAAQRAGLQDSGAGLAMENQINRQAGDARTRAMQNVDIENAVQGLQNTRLAAPMELGRQTSAAAMANQMALENASRMFAGMQQNVANVQQASGINTQNQQQREMSRAQTQAGTQSNMAQDYNSALLNRANAADQGNVQNEINRGLNQAQLDRQRDIYNVGTGENRYGQAFGGYLGLISGTNPASYNLGSANIGAQYSPNLFPSNTAQNVGNAALEAARRRT